MHSSLVINALGLKTLGIESLLYRIPHPHYTELLGNLQVKSILIVVLNKEMNIKVIHDVFSTYFALFMEKGHKKSNISVSFIS